MGILLKRIYSLVVPGGVLVVGAALLLRGGQTETVTALLRFFPYAVLGGGVLLGWRFHRTGVVFPLLALALADQALQHFAGPGSPSAALPSALLGAGGTSAPAVTDAGWLVFQATALLLPLNLAGFSLLSERGALWERAAVGAGVLAGQVLVVAAMAGLAPAGGAELWEHAFLQDFLTGWTPVSQPALLAFLLALALLLARCLLNRRALDNGFLWATVAAFLGVHSFGFSLGSLGEGGQALLRSSSSGGQATLYFSTAGLILAVAVVEASYAMAYRDELTRLPARRALNEALERMGEDYAIAMVDVDHFKKFNDTYGHKVGDQVLQMVAARLERVAGGGTAFRYGGEEFSVLFPGRSVEEALPHLEEVREAIAESKFTLRGPDRPRRKPKKSRRASASPNQVSVTVSMGVADPSASLRARPDARHTTPQEVIQAADKALYRAKKGGRNQVRT